jgi:hypothetical protein
MIDGSAFMPTTLPPASPAFDTAAVRELLTAAFSDEELTIFCYDYFRAVHEKFGSGMSKPAKIQLLIEECEPKGRLGTLLDWVRETNSACYACFRQSEPTQGRAKLSPKYVGCTSLAP